MSRFDAVGIWWQDFPVEKRASGRLERAVRSVEVPASDWAPPKEFPNLTGVKIIGLDTETKDLELLERGPGGVRGAGHVIGVSVAAGEAAWYWPLRHEYAPQSELNCDPDKVLAWLGDLLKTPVPIVGANLLYDLEMLRAAGVRRPAGKLIDVQYAEALIDEESRSYALESLAQKYLGAGKETPVLYQWCADSFGGRAGPEQRSNLWRSPPTLVGPYAEADALLPLRIWEKQRPILEAEHTIPLLEMECGLIPLLLDMRFRGVPVDLDKAEKIGKWLRAEAAKAQAELGNRIDVWSGASLAAAFDREKIEYERTEAGNPSFTRPWLEANPHPLAKAVLRVRTYEKAANPFVESYILQGHSNGRIHCQFHPLRGDEYGTVSGRFSSSNPNLQNIPSRDPVLGPLLRSIFVPEQGCRWRRGDHSQIEYRLLVHFAKGDGAEEARRRYRDDPSTDFHDATIVTTRENTGITLDRKPAKNLNFGMVYGMGKDRVVSSLGTSYQVGVELYDAYHRASPYVKATLESAQRLANHRGYIMTLMKRRSRFNRMEKSKYSDTMQRAGTHKALNRVLQGTAADIMKKGMLDCYEAGVFDQIGIPHLTVHDELDWSDDGSEAAARGFVQAADILENCVKLKVPLRVEMSEGANWGECL